MQKVLNCFTIAGVTGCLFIILNEPGISEPCIVFRWTHRRFPRILVYCYPHWYLICLNFNSMISEFFLSVIQETPTRFQGIYGGQSLPPPIELCPVH